ncbi:hypothetical protein MHYP_G00037850 [Metynnis hypsauchen]
MADAGGWHCCREARSKREKEKFTGVKWVQWFNQGFARIEKTLRTQATKADALVQAGRRAENKRNWFGPPGAESMPKEVNSCDKKSKSIFCGQM